MDSLPPFLWGSFIPDNMPVYPGAPCMVTNTEKWIRPVTDNLSGGHTDCFQTSSFYRLSSIPSSRELRTTIEHL